MDIFGSGPRTEGDGTLIERDAGTGVRTVSLGVAIGGRESTIRDLAIQVPSGNNNTGLQTAGEVGNVVVDAATSPTPPTNSVGISMNGNGQTLIGDVDVTLPPTSSLGVRLALARLENSSVKASTGVQGNGPVRRSTIEANLGAQSSELKLEDCVMRISGPNGVALSSVGIGFNVFSRIKARHVTIIGDSDPTSLAALAEAEGSTSSNSADVEIRNSIIRGFARNFKRRAVNSKTNTGTANLDRRLLRLRRVHSERRQRRPRHVRRHHRQHLGQPGLPLGHRPPPLPRLGADRRRRSRLPGHERLPAGVHGRLRRPPA